MVFLDGGQPVCFIDRLQNSSAVSVGHHRLMRPTSFLVELDPLRLRHGIDDNRMNFESKSTFSHLSQKNRTQIPYAQLRGMQQSKGNYDVLHQVNIAGLFS